MSLFEEDLRVAGKAHWTERITAFRRRSRRTFVIAAHARRAPQQTVPVVSVQNKYNIADRTHEGVLHFCEKHHLGFIPWFPMEQGKLNRPGSVLERADAMPELFTNFCPRTARPSELGPI